MLAFQCSPITRLVALYSSAECMMPEATLRSYLETGVTFISAEAAIIAAFSRFFPHCCFLSCMFLLSVITLRATSGRPSFVSLIIRARFMRFSVVSGFATGISICSGTSSVSTLESLKWSFSSSANFLAERSVARELIIHVKRIITMVPLSTSSFIRRSPFSIIIPCPTRTAARVAAAEALLSPKIMFLSFFFIPKIFWVANAPIHLLPMATTVIIAATLRACPPVKSALTSISIPTPMRKYGMNIAFPTNSSLFISGDT